MAGRGDVITPPARITRNTIPIQLIPLMLTAGFALLDPLHHGCVDPLSPHLSFVGFTLTAMRKSVGIGLVAILNAGVDVLLLRARKECAALNQSNRRENY